MEVTSEELISQTQRREAVEVANELCIKACAALADVESAEIARATLHEAINSSARYVAEAVVLRAAPGARETVDHYLKDASRYPNIMQAVADAAEPAARDAALAAVRAWSKERATKAAADAAQKVLSERLVLGGGPMLETAVLATLHVLVERSENVPAGGQGLRDLLNEVGEKAAEEAASRAFTPELRRAAQSAAVIAAGSIAKDATEDIAAEAAEFAARQAATDTIRLEVLSLVKAEAQRRAARQTREALKDVSDIPLPKLQQHCYDEAMKIAREAAESAIGEIAMGTLEIDQNRVFELAAAAASAVAREVSDALMPVRNDTNPWKLIFIAVQVSVGCVLIWFYLLGGSAQLPSLLKPILPPDLYRSFYPPKPEPNNLDTTPVDPKLDEVLQGDSPAGQRPGRLQTPASELDLDNPVVPMGDAAPGSPAPSASGSPNSSEPGPGATVPAGSGGSAPTGSTPAGSAPTGAGSTGPAPVVPSSVVPTSPPAGSSSAVGSAPSTPPALPPAPADTAE